MLSVSAARHLRGKHHLGDVLAFDIVELDVELKCPSVLYNRPSLARVEERVFWRFGVDALLELIYWRLNRAHLAPVDCPSSGRWVC